VRRRQTDRRLRALPEELLARCGEISAELKAASSAGPDDRVSEERILTARVRICSGYYDSESVRETIASRMLSHEIPRPDKSLAG
jgi:hypothetical protein